MPLLVALYEDVMLALLEHPNLACSPDTMAFIKWDASVSDCREGSGYIQFGGDTLRTAPVEI